jgi:DNA polymerase-3 subunit epsilon
MAAERGVILDLETTGLDPALDSIIEIGIIECVLTENLPQITNIYGAIEDPGKPLAPEIVALTGLTDEALHGRKIDWRIIRSLLEGASIVVAHNAEFDSNFLMRREELKGLILHWACSVRHIDWDGKGFKTRKLGYLAADHGFVNPFPHRAVFDCATTFKLIAPHIHELASNSYQKDFRVIAVNAPFETKDLLKSRGYFWDGNQRVWTRVLLGNRLAEERKFLSDQIYRKGHDQHIEQELSPLGSSQ